MADEYNVIINGLQNNNNNLINPFPVLPDLAHLRPLPRRFQPHLLQLHPRHRQPVTRPLPLLLRPLLLRSSHHPTRHQLRRLPPPHRQNHLPTVPRSLHPRGCLLLRALLYLRLLLPLRQTLPALQVLAEELRQITLLPHLAQTHHPHHHHLLSRHPHRLHRRLLLLLPTLH